MATGGLQTAMHQGARCAARITLQALAWGAVIVFVFITYVRPTDWYNNSPVFKQLAKDMTLKFPEGVPLLTQVVIVQGKETIKIVGNEQDLWGGKAACPVTLQWGTVLVAALCMAGLQAMNLMRPEQRPAKQETTLGGMAAFVWRKIRQVANYPLPPRQLWDWWCGGLTVRDALLVCLWLGLALTYLRSTIFKAIRGAAKKATTATFLELRIKGVGKATGETLRGLVMLIFLPISRSSFLKWMTGQEFSTLIKYHRWISHGTFVIVAMHSIIFFVYWGCNGAIVGMLTWKTEADADNVGVSGFIAGMAMLIMTVTASSWFRRAYYNLFLRTHIACFLVFVVFIFFHYKGIASWIMPGLILYFFDRAFRFWQTAGNWTYVNAGDVRVEDGAISLGLDWADKQGAVPILPGQTIYLRVPRLALFQSHPFSVADVSRDEAAPGITRVTLHFKRGGDWSHGFAKLAQAGQSILLQAEGPYETALASSVLTPVVVMVGGGIGITPLLGLLRHWLRLGDSPCALPGHSGLLAARPRKCYLVWSARSLGMLRLLGADLLGSASPITSDYNSGDEKPALMAAEHGFTSQHTTEARGWLCMALHYTGFEQDNSKANLAKSKGPATSLSVSVSSDGGVPLSDTSFPVTLLAQHPASSPLLYAICALVSFFGAWAGLMAAQYNQGRIARTHAVGEDAYSWGTSQILLMAVGAIVPPLIALAVGAVVSKVANAWFSSRAAAGRATAAQDPAVQLEMASQRDKAWGKETTAGQPHGDQQAEAVGVMRHTWGAYMASNALTVLPGYVLAPATSTSGGMELQRGRPNMRSMLQGVQAEHMDVAEVTVLVGGPECLWLQVRELCTELSPLWMDSQHPVLAPVRVAHGV